MSDFSTKHPELFAMLAAPFSDEEVRTRSQGGRQLLYVTASTVANRLDDACGPENWEFELSPWGDDALFGTLTITLPDGSKVRKMNVGGCADMPEGDNDAKSAASDALKRCAAMVGVARYLYQSGTPEFVRSLFDNFKGHQNVQNGGGYQSSPRQDFGPPPPRQSAPQGNGGGYSNGNGGGQRNGGGNGGGRQFDDTQCPKHGRGLFAWCKGKQEKDGHDWVGDVNATIEDHFGRRMKMVDMSGEQVQEVWPLITGSRNAQPAAALDRGNGDGIPF